MRILITGGLGYVGGRIAHYLGEKEPDSTLFLTTRKENDEVPAWAADFHIIQMNVLDEESIANCLRDKGIDVIIHLAAINEIDSMKDPALAMDVNAMGTYRLLRHAQNNGINHFIYFSTFHVYGENAKGLITEETPTRPFHPYAISHRAAEDFVTFFQHYHGLKTLILRLSNGYGFPMDKNINRWTLVFNDLCRQGVSTGNIVLKTSGEQSRDFISLDDVAQAIYHFVFMKTGEWGDGLFNLGGKRSMSIMDVAKRIVAVYEATYSERITISSPPEKKGNPEEHPQFVYDISKLKSVGFNLRNEMEDEIRRTFQVCSEQGF